jgi:hypothetical protein
MLIEKDPECGAGAGGVANMTVIFPAIAWSWSVGGGLYCGHR